MSIFKKKTSEQELENRIEQPAAGLARQKIGVLIRPHITEKTTAAAVHRTYIFSVARDANKMDIKSAIQGKYNVAVTDIRVVNIHGKETRRGQRVGWHGRMKKAYATLAEGQMIEVQ